MGNNEFFLISFNPSCFVQRVPEHKISQGFEQASKWIEAIERLPKLHTSFVEAKIGGEKQPTFLKQIERNIIRKITT